MNRSISPPPTTLEMQRTMLMNGDVQAGIRHAYFGCVYGLLVFGLISVLRPFNTF